MRWLMILILGLGACGKRLGPKPAEGPSTAYTLRGTIRFANPNVAGAAPVDASFGGDVTLLLWSRSSEGYCLAGAFALAGEFDRAILNPDRARLEGDGYPYALAVDALPDQAYPITIYPSALWQGTVQRFHACESVGLGCFGNSCSGAVPAGSQIYNALGFYGLSLADYQRGATSACCGYFGQPVTVTAAGAVIDNVDILMVPERPVPGQSCPSPGEAFDVCSFRHGENLGTDSACYQAVVAAVGLDAASQLFERADGKSCP